VWGCWRKHFTYFCPGVDCQCYWFFYVHSVCNGPLCDFLRCHRPVQVLKMDVQDVSLPIGDFPLSVPLYLGTHISCIVSCWQSVSQGIDISGADLVIFRCFNCNLPVMT
jgi:hypothetical protein